MSVGCSIWSICISKSCSSWMSAGVTECTAFPGPSVRLWVKFEWLGKVGATAANSMVEDASRVGFMCILMSCSTWTAAGVTECTALPRPSVWPWVKFVLLGTNCSLGVGQCIAVFVGVNVLVAVYSSWSQLFPGRPREVFLSSSAGPGTEILFISLTSTALWIQIESPEETSSSGGVASGCVDILYIELKSNTISCADIVGLGAIRSVGWSGGNFRHGTTWRIWCKNSYAFISGTCHLLEPKDLLDWMKLLSFIDVFEEALNLSCSNISGVSKTKVLW